MKKQTKEIKIAKEERKKARKEVYNQGQKGEKK
jgi:hypothetical protein